MSEEKNGGWDLEEEKKQTGKRKKKIRAQLIGHREIPGRIMPSPVGPTSGSGNLSLREVTSRDL